MRQLACDNRLARGSTYWRIRIGVIEANSLGSQPVKVWRSNPSVAVTTQHFSGMIVTHNKEDVADARGVEREETDRKDAENAERSSEGFQGILRSPILCSVINSLPEIDRGLISRTAGPLAKSRVPTTNGRKM